MAEGSASRPLALITGASVGIGYELARVFARHGHDLVLVARDGARLETVAAECRAMGAACRVLAKDLSVPAAPREIHEELRSEGARVSVLVNNAGFGTHGPFADIDLDSDLRLLQVNIVSLTDLTKRFLRDMLTDGRGKIMNVASTAAYQPGPFMATYYASKAYVLHLTEAIADEVQDFGITVTALCPGPTLTEFSKRAGMEHSRIFKKNAMRADEVALAGYHGLMRGRRVVVPGKMNALLVRSVRLFPRRALTRITRLVNLAK